MLYSNRKLISEEVEFDFGKISQISLGEKGRGRQLLTLTCPKDTIVNVGENKGLTIGLTKSGRPRIVSQNEDDGRVYLLLSSEGGYTRRGCGAIYSLVQQEKDIKILSWGNGADGSAGRVGTWTCMLLEVPSDNCIIRVRPGGYGYGLPSELYLVSDGKVYNCHPRDLPVICDSIGIDMPCRVTGAELDRDEWVVLQE